MPNKNYVKGCRKEYRIVKELRHRGYNIVQRTAGSHSPIDILAINRLTRVICLVQSKPDSLSKSKKEKIELENCWLNNPFRVEFRVL